MDSEKLKRLDKRISKIQYPFGENFPIFNKIFMELAEQENISLQDVIRQYAGWKYSRK